MEHEAEHEAGHQVRQADSTKVYRRRIRIENPRPGVVFGALEDTAHHVRVTVRFRDRVVATVTGEAVRLPWTTCPGAAAGLASLDGTQLSTSLSRLRHLYDPPAHCTHFFDLAQLALAHAAAGRRTRTYEVAARATATTTTASLLRDGEAVLDWTIEDGRIIRPESFAGVGLREGFVRWAEAHLSEDGAEAAFVLRRAASMSRIADLRMDDYPVVSETGLPPGTCFTAQPERMPVAYRNVGSQRDYSASAEGMLDGFDAALARAAAGAQGSQ